MKEDGSLIKSGLNGLFLAGTGVLVLLTKGILFAGPIEYIVAGAATLWGVYVLLTDRTRRNVGLASLAGGGMMMIFGGLLQAGASITGFGLIIAGIVSFFSGLVQRGRS